MRRLFLAAVVLTAAAALPSRAAAAGPCDLPVVTPVACENSKPGTPASNWQVNGIGDSSIQGYATSMSVDKGQTIRFKIKTTASAYHVDVLRLGYYQGLGARMWQANIRPSATLPQTQPSCIATATTGLIDCGNWGVSASWTVPWDAVSGVYIAHLVRDDTGASSQIPFVVRDDAGHSGMVIKTSDATWQAYNAYGGNSLYSCTVSCPPGNPLAYKAAYSVSYNRPWDGTLVTDAGQSYIYYAEYQMIRFVERNGYDVSYIADADADANGALLRNHRMVMSSAHDEYWSKGERENLEAARDAGVNLAFFSANEGFWKTRWEASSADGTSTPYRTLTTYKETHFNAQVDPARPGTWTGTWRDPRFSPPGDGGRAENSLTGQYFIVNSGTSDIKVPAAFAKLRLWRGTAAASLTGSQTLTLSPGGGTLGYEWDVDPDNGFRPAGLFDLSSTTVTGAETFSDYGSTTTHTNPTHNLTMYRAPSGALVFGAGTVQWAWGLDDTNAWGQSTTEPSRNAPDSTMQQATINLFGDMGLQPVTPMAGMNVTPGSSDTTPPTSTVTAPSEGAAISDGVRVTVTGTARDTGGNVAGVEVSTDGGTSWHPATGTTSWTYSWPAHGAPAATIVSRAVDDSGNIEASPTAVHVSISCPCTLWGQNVAPEVVDSGDTQPVEVGFKFKSDLHGTVSGVRFYKATANTGTHIGNLWSADGTLLARATFTGESASGWHQVTFQTPVTIQQGVTYLASYYAPKGHYSSSDGYFFKPSPLGGNMLDAGPLHAIVANGGVGNGVYSYDTATGFPSSDGDGTNYGVDIMFTPTALPGPVTAVTATAGPGSATVDFSAPASGGAPTRYIVTPYIGSDAQPTTTVTGSPPATKAYVSGLDPSSSYTFTVQPGNPNGIGPVSSPSNAVTPAPPVPPDAPTGVDASPGDASATLHWTAPKDGGRPILRYTITPYVNGLPQPATIVNGSPAPTSAIVTGLVNGAQYTFTVTAANAIGKGAESAPSAAVTTGPAPRFLQRVTIRNPASRTVQLTPAANITVGDRIVVMAGVWNAAASTISGVTDSAGNTYTKVTSIKASDDTELSVWTAPVTAGDGTRPVITVTATGTADIGAAAVEYANLGGVDQFAAATGTAAAATSGATAAATADNALALGFYVDSGFGRTLVADPAYTERVNVSPTTDMEFVVEDDPVARGDRPAARVTTGAGTPWTMATVVFKPAGGGAPTPPAPPAGVGAQPGDGKATVTWSAPSNGGSPITGYTITPYIGADAQTPVQAGAGATSATVTGLANGISYTFRVSATNTAGTGPASAASPAVTPSPPSAPDAPAGVAATAGTAKATVSWTAPSNGGSPITGYVVTPYAGNTALTPTTVTGSPPATTATVAGLTNGTAYTFTVAATNAIGTGPASARSGAVTPAAFAPPAFVQQANGRALATSVTVTPAGNITAGNRLVVLAGVWSSAKATISGVTDSSGNTYTKLTSIKAADDTELSVWSAPITAGGGTKPAVRIAATGSADIGATVVEYSGLSTVADATVVDKLATATGNTSAAATVASGATAATTADQELAIGFYADSGFGASLVPDATFTTRLNLSPTPDMEFVVEDRLVAAGSTPNATVRTGASVPWMMATVVFKTAGPVAPSAPGAPTGVTATGGDRKATVSWTAPSSNGGSPITGYTVTPYIGTVAQTPATVTGTSTTVTGLANGTAYTFKVTATNAIGDGPASAASNAVTPAAPAAPGAPTGVSATAGNAKATVSWTAPSSDGGSPITGYTVTPYVGTVAQTPATVTGTSTTVTGLANGTAYTFKVTATNAIGTGPASAASNAVTPTALVSPAFVQSVSKRVKAKTDVLAPAANITAGNRIVVLASAWSSAKATVSGVTDSAGNTYAKLTSIKASDDTELSVWSATITAGAGTKPSITVTASGTADVGASAVEYSGLSTAAGTAVLDGLATATGLTSAAGSVASGATGAATGDQELAIGLYADSGFGATLVADSAFTQRVNVSPTSDMEFVVEDRVVSTGATSNATVRTGAGIPWLMATVVLKNRG